MSGDQQLPPSDPNSGWGTTPPPSEPTSAWGTTSAPTSAWSTSPTPGDTAAYPIASPPQAPAAFEGVPGMMGVPAGGGRNGVGTAGLIIGILAIIAALTLIFFWVGWPLAVAGLICSIIGLKRANRGEASNRGQAVTGIILNIIALVFASAVGIFFAIAGLALFSEAGSAIESAVESAQTAPTEAPGTPEEPITDDIPLTDGLYDGYALENEYEYPEPGSDNIRDPLFVQAVRTSGVGEDVISDDEVLQLAAETLSAANDGQPLSDLLLLGEAAGLDEAQSAFIIGAAIGSYMGPEATTDLFDDLLE